MLFRRRLFDAWAPLGALAGGRGRAFARALVLSLGLLGLTAAPYTLAPEAAAAGTSFHLPKVGYSAVRQVRGGDRRQSMRVYYSPGKERMELEGAAAGGNVIIVRYDRQVTWVVMPQLHIYVELPAEVSDRYLNLMQGLSLTPVGHARINGAAATKYRVRGGLDGYMWLDRAGIPLRIEGETKIGGKPTRAEVEQTEVSLRSPAPSLFELPAGFARIQLTDPAWIAMLQRYLPDR